LLARIITEKVFNPKLASLHIRRTERGEKISIISGIKDLTGGREEETDSL